MTTSDYRCYYGYNTGSAWGCEYPLDGNPRQPVRCDLISAVPLTSIAHQLVGQVIPIRFDDYRQAGTTVRQQRCAVCGSACSLGVCNWCTAVLGFVSASNKS